MNRKNIQYLQKRKQVQPWCYFAVICAVYSLLLPKYSLFTSYNGAAGILLGTVGLCVIHRGVLAGRKTDRGKEQKKKSKLLAFLRLVGYVAIVCALTAVTALFMRDCFFTGMTLFMACFLCVLLLLPAWGKKKEVWLRMLAVSAAGLSLFVAGLPLLGLRQVAGAMVTAMPAWDLKQILLAAGVYMVLSWYVLVLPRTEKKGMWPDSKEGLFLLTGIFLAFLCILFRLIYGAQGTAYRRWPMLSLLQGISVPGKFLERVDALWAGAVIFACFLAVGLLLEKIYVCLKILGVREKSARLWRWKDMVAFGLLVLTLFVYRYSGVEVQNRAYVGAFVADWTEDGYVFWFPWQEKNEATAISAKSFAAARKILGASQNLQPDFGHIAVTVLGKRLLAQPEAAERLFTELAGWQEMDENSYAFAAADPGTLMEADTGGESMGKYISALYENRFGASEDHLTLQQLLVAWENGMKKRDLPELTKEKDTLWIKNPER